MGAGHPVTRGVRQTANVGVLACVVSHPWEGVPGRVCASVLVRALKPKEMFLKKTLPRTTHGDVN